MENIDNFFKKRLEGVEITPSDRARNLFLEKIEDNKKGKFIIFSNSRRLFFGAAASILMFACVGVFFYLSTQKSTIAENNSKNDIEKHSLDKVVKVVPNLALSSKYASNELVIKPPVENINIKTTEKLEELNVLNNSTIAQDIPLALAENVKQDISIEEIKPSVIPVLKSMDLLSKNALSETIVYISSIQEQEIVVVSPSFEIETNQKEKIINSDVEESSDKTLFAKVVDEIRHIKNGEKVDFNKLGLKPVEELTLNQDGFIASETRQIKETYSWIKSKITNN